uniref:Uncharacterized protein n=1 Tax=Rhizochromulina marina TaxID=1034831 RepID=A0A7S2RKF1_9STRA
MVGGFFVHIANIGTAEVLQGIAGDDADECAFYFLNFFIDCTIGVVIVYGIHEAICRTGVRLFGPESALSHIGHYGDPPVITVWGKQLGVYLSALLVNKLIVASFLYVTLGAVTKFGNWLFSPLQAHPNTELLVVMVLCPWILQTLQFWLFDFVLKAKPGDLDHEYRDLNSKEECSTPRLDEGHADADFDGKTLDFDAL